MKRLLNQIYSFTHLSSRCVISETCHPTGLRRPLVLHVIQVQLKKTIFFSRIHLSFQQVLNICHIACHAWQAPMKKVKNEMWRKSLHDHVVCCHTVSNLPWEWPYLCMWYAVIQHVIYILSHLLPKLAHFDFDQFFILCLCVCWASSKATQCYGVGSMCVALKSCSFKMLCFSRREFLIALKTTTWLQCAAH